MLAPNYFEKKSETRYLSNSPQLTPAMRRQLARYNRMHTPPTRMQWIPMCQPGRQNNAPQQTRNYTPGYFKNKRTYSPADPASLISTSSGANENSEVQPISDLNQPSSSKSGTGNEAIKPKYNCKFLRPESPVWSAELCGKRPCPTWTDQSGVRITEITGFEDPNEPFEPITIIGRKTTPEITKRHPRHVLKRNGMYFVRVDRIVNPNRFFMEFIMKPPRDENVDWDESLQRFYNEPGVAEKHKLRTLRPYIGQMYAVYNDELKKWERVRVHALVKGAAVSGMYLDRLHPFNGIPASSLHELHPNYGNWPKHPLSGSLCDVRPVGFVSDDDNENAHLDWPQEAIDYFKDYVKDKLFRAFIVSKKTDKSDKLWHASDEDRFCQVDVYLFEVGAKHQIPLNAWMVHKGLAVPTKSLNGCHELMQILYDVKPGDEDATQS